MSYFVFYVLLVICYACYCSGSERGRELICLLSFVIMWFLFGEVSSFSRCLGRAALFYCGTP